ncbi:MAG: dipeptide ABC transporter ATP-binding protein [Chloroflexota bacterium]
MNNTNREPIIELDDLSVGYRNRAGDIVHVLRNIDLAIRPGETVGIVGESGSGKSTVALSMMAYLRSGSELLNGSVNFHGNDLYGMSSREIEDLRGKKIALIPQNAGQSLTPTMRIGEQIDEALRLHTNLPAPERLPRTIELLGQVRLPAPEELVERYPHELSGGQQQRVAVAMALAGEAELLLLDEPTTGLDVTTQAHILELLRDLAEETGTAMVYVSHDLGVITRVSHRVAVMYAGEVVEDGPSNDVMVKPNHPYARGLLGSIPRLKDENLPASLPGTPPAVGSILSGCAFRDRCPFATDICTDKDPPLVAIPGSQPVHKIRCHHWEKVVEEEMVRIGNEVDRYGGDGTEKPLLELNDVQITYYKRRMLDPILGVKAPPPTVDDISLAVRRGETLALVGESGSGKSTIIRTVAGLKPPKSGQVTFDGENLNLPIDRRDKELRRRIQLIFQNPDASLNPRQTVAEILAMPLRLYFGADEAEVDEKSRAILRRVRLGEHYMERYPSQLSGGEKQRVAIARAFVADPELILCDEVTSALDVSVQAAVLDLLYELKNEDDATYVFISHDLAVVKAVSDQVAVLYQGRLCEVGPVNDIYVEPHHPYTETLLGAVLEPEPGSEPKLNADDIIESNPPAIGCSFQRRCPYHLGEICDKETPPWRMNGDGGHKIRCHIPLDELLADQQEA